MADTFSLRFEIDASSAEAGAKRFSAAINSVTKSLSTMDASAAKAFAKLSQGASGDFSAVSKQLAKLSNININPSASKSITALGNAFANLKAPSPTAIRNITTFADVVPKLLNGFNVSGNFASSLNNISTAMANFKVPSLQKIEALAIFGQAIKEIAPTLKITGSFSGIANLGTALGEFKAPSSTAVANLKAFFSALNGGGSKVAINASMVNGIANLSNAVAGIKAPSATAVTNLKNLFNALGTFKPVSGSNSLTTIAAAFANFKGPTAAQTKNVENFVVTLGQLKVPANAAALSSYLNSVAAAAGNAGKALAGFKTSLGNLGGSGSSGSASAGIKSLIGDVRGLENAFSGTFQAASVFRTLIGSITIGSLSKSFYDANLQLNAFKGTLSAANNGDIVATGKDLRYVEDMADRLGQQFGVISQSYGGFAVSAQLAGVSVDDTRKIFEATVTAMTVLHRTSDQTSLALLAMEQMMSKGTISSEELRRQLGEQLPGAVNLMARAIGHTTSELQQLLKAGALASSDVLPKFADEIQKTYGGTLAFALQNANAQFNILSNRITDIYQVAGQSGAMAGLATAIKTVSTALSDPAFLGFAQEFGERVGKVLPMVGDAFAYLVAHASEVITIFKVILAMNIAKFFQGFIGVLLGSAGGLGAIGGAFAKIGSSIGALAEAATVGGAALKTFGVAAAFVEALSGPVGILIVGLGVLATSFMGASSHVTDFSAGLDTSKEALDRYKESIQEFTRAQLIANGVELNKKIDAIKDSASAAAAEYKVFTDRVNAAGQYQKSQSPAQQIIKTLSDASKVIEETGGSYDNLIANLSRTTTDSAAKAILNDFIAMRAAIDKNTPALKLAQDQLAANQATMNGMSSVNAVAVFEAVGMAAQSMAGQVASATQELIKVSIQARENESQLAVAPQLAAIGKASDEFDTKISKTLSGQDADKASSLFDNTQTVTAIAQVTKLGEAIQKTKQIAADNKAGRSIINDISEGADEVKTKVASIQAQIYKVTNTPYSDEGKRKSALDVLNQRLADAQKGPKKPKGAGPTATDKMLNGLDPSGDTSATAKLTAEEDKLNKLFKSNKITADQYGTAMAALREKFKGTAAGQEALTAEFEKLKEELDPGTGKLVEFTDKQNILKNALDANKISVGEYTEMLLKLRKAYAGTAQDASQPAFVKGINKGLLDLTKTGDDFVNDIASTVGSAFNSLGDALSSWVVDGKLDFDSLTKSILSDVAKIVIQYAVMQPIIKALSSVFSSLGLGGTAAAADGTASLGGFDLGAGSTAIASAKGNVFSSGNLVKFANGGLTNGSNSGIVSSPTLFAMGGTKTGLMGEAGPEAIMPLTRGPDGSLGVQASGAATAATQHVSVQPQVNVNISSPAGTSSSVQQKSNGQGGLDLGIIIEQIKDSVAGDVAKGGTKLNKAFENRYNQNPASGNRR